MATPEELKKAKAIAAEIDKQFKMKDHKTNLQIARYILLLIGTLNLLGIFWYTFGPVKMSGIIYVNGPLAAIFCTLYFTSKYKPVISVGIGLALYVLIHFLVLLVASEEFFRGSIWKIMTIVLLIIGLVAAVKIEKQKPKELDVLDQLEEGDIV